MYSDVTISEGKTVQKTLLAVYLKAEMVWGLEVVMKRQHHVFFSHPTPFQEKKNCKNE